MKQVLLKVFLFIFVVGVLDFVFGLSINYLFKHAKGGEVYREKYICEQMKADMVIFGSSRAIHHYDPKILSDSLHMSCFNAGYDGNGILLMYAQYKMMNKHHIPKYILYDINPDADYYDDGDKHRFLNPIRAYYDIKGIDSIFWKVDELDHLKYLSNLYKYNTVFTQFISAYTSKNYSMNAGWKPMDKVMTQRPKDNEIGNILMTEKKVDEVKKYYFLRLISECKSNGTKLFFLVSPYYNSDDTKYNDIKRIAQENDIPFISYASDSCFRKKDDYFYDSVHLNRTGASAYSKAIVKDIKQKINIYEDTYNRNPNL